MSSAMPSPCKMSGKNQPNNILLRIADVKKEIINTKTVLSLCYKWSIWLQRYMLNKSTKHQIWHMILCVTDKLGCWYHVWDSSGFYSYTYSRLEMVTCPFCYTFIIYHSSLKGKSTVFWCRSFCLDTLRYLAFVIILDNCVMFIIHWVDISVVLSVRILYIRISVWLDQHYLNLL